MLKERKNEEKLEKNGNKYVYTQNREVEMDFDDVLQIQTREKMNIEEAKNGLTTLRTKIRKATDFLARNKSLFEEAKKISDQQFCEVCGMDFLLPANKDMKSSKTKKPYQVMCKNCAKKQGL
jgi:hypothetical protein